MEFKEYEQKNIKTSRLNINLPLSSKKFLESEADRRNITMTDFVLWLVEKERAESREG